MERSPEKWTADRVMNDLDDIIEHILSLLPMTNLHQCARVCRKWRTICDRIKNTRNQLVWLLSTSTDSRSVQQDINKQLQVIPSEPKFALVFSSNQMFEMQLAVPSNSGRRVSRFPRAAKMGRLVITDYLQKVLPPSCSIVCSASDGVVGTVPSHISLLELENTSAVSCLLMPELEDMIVTHFLITPDKEQRLAANVTSEDLIDPEILTDVLGLPPGKRPKLVLLFETEKPVFVSQPVDVDYLLLRCFENIVIAGGYVDDIFPETETPNAEVGDCRCIGVAFCGDDIKVASVIIGHNVHKKDEVRQRLKRLQNCNVPPTKRIGFMFACIGRGEHYYKEKNLESGVFHSLFPDVPLFGFFGNGEIGYDYLPDYSSPEGSSNYSLFGEYPDDESGVIFDMPAINHSYTSIFVLVSLGKD